MVKKLLLIFVLAFLFNGIWEVAHSYLYDNVQGGTITLWILSRAAIVDAAIITLMGIAFIKLPFLNKRIWWSLVFGLVISIAIELYALNIGMWQYNQFMPLIPRLNIGLTPTIQLGLLSYATYNLVRIKQA